MLPHEYRSQEAMSFALLRKGLLAMMAALAVSCGGGSPGSGQASSQSTAVTVPAPSQGLAGDAANFSAGEPGTGIGGIAAEDGSTTTAAASGGGGDDSSGVGSGGTGVSTGGGTGVGAVDGAGSVIVIGLRYDTRTAVGQLEDAPSGLQLGMTVKVIGPVNADFTRGVARRIESAAELRGPVDWVNVAEGRFAILGTTVKTDEATVWADMPGPGAIRTGSTLQVWGLPAAPGVLLATRIEQRGAASAILTGTVQNLNALHSNFTLGSIVVDYSGAPPFASPDAGPLANGMLVRVRGDAVATARFRARQVQSWYPLPRAETTIAQFAGTVTDFAGLASLRVLGFPVDASAVLVTGGPPGSVGNGVKVEVGGVVVGGVLRASKFMIRNVPGAGGPASFRLIGHIGEFSSTSDFRVRGQAINAANPDVVFINGRPEDLARGVRVDVRGSHVVNGVLMAQTISFD